MNIYRYLQFHVYLISLICHTIFMQFHKRIYPATTRTLCDNRVHIVVDIFQSAPNYLNGQQNRHCKTFAKSFSNVCRYVRCRVASSYNLFIKINHIRYPQLQYSSRRYSSSHQWLDIYSSKNALIFSRICLPIFCDSFVLYIKSIVHLCAYLRSCPYVQSIVRYFAYPFSEQYPLYCIVVSAFLCILYNTTIISGYSCNSYTVQKL